MSFSIYSARPLRPPAMPLSIDATRNAHDARWPISLENLDNVEDFEDFKEKAKQ